MSVLVLRGLAGFDLCQVFSRAEQSSTDPQPVTLGQSQRDQVGVSRHGSVVGVVGVVGVTLVRTQQRAPQGPVMGSIANPGVGLGSGVRDGLGGQLLKGCSPEDRRPKGDSEDGEELPHDQTP